MYAHAKSKSKFRTLAFLGLVLIFSLMVSRVAWGEAINSGLVTETIAIAGDDFEDTVGEGLTVEVNEVSASTPQPPQTDGKIGEEPVSSEGSHSDEVNLITIEKEYDDDDDIEMFVIGPVDNDDDNNEQSVMGPVDDDDDNIEKIVMGPVEDDDDNIEKTVIGPVDDDDDDNTGDDDDGDGDRKKNGQETCPKSNGWVKVDSLSSTTYTHTAPAGKLVSDVCYKASTTVIYYEVLPPESPHTVVSTVWNKEGCDGPTPPNGCNIQNLSHASFKYVDDVEEEDPTITIDTDCTWDGKVSKGMLTINYSTEEIETLWWNLTGNPADNAVYSGQITSSALVGTLYYSWAGKGGYSDGSESFDFDIDDCEPDPPDLKISIQSVGSSCEDIPVVIRVTNNGGGNAFNVNVSMTIDSGNQYVAGILDMPHTFATVPAGGFVEHTATIQTNPATWKHAPAGTEIHFTASIDDFDVSTSSSPESENSAAYPMTHTMTAIRLFTPGTAVLIHS